MSSSRYTQEIERLEREIAELQRKVSMEQKKEANLQNRIAYIRSTISRYTSQSLVRSKSRQIVQLENDLAKTARKKADFLGKVADKGKQLANKREQLQDVTEREHKKQQRLTRERDRQIYHELTSLQAQTVDLQALLDANIDPERVLVEVFVLEGDLSQGTCFNLAGVGLITCQHVLTTPLTLFHPSEVAKRFLVRQLAANPVLDLARILAAGLQLGTGLPLGSAEDIHLMDEIYLAGFPNYRLGDSGILVRGRVSGFRTVSGIRRVLIDTPIVSGNSGGPVLNSQGEVIGVAVTGSDRMEDAGSTENHAIIPIDALSLLS